MMKALTRHQLQARKEKAVRFIRDVLDDPDRADEIEDESLEEYAERRKIQITKRKSCGASFSIPAFVANSRTTCQTTFSVMLSPQIRPALFTRRNSLPEVIPVPGCWRDSQEPGIVNPTCFLRPTPEHSAVNSTTMLRIATD